MTWIRDDNDVDPAVTFELTYGTPERASLALARVLEAITADSEDALRELGY